MPSRGFAKLDVGIVDSTLWMKPHDALRVWIALLAKCDSLGIVRASAPAMAHLCFVTLERFEEIINEFSSPDEHSRTPDHGGRRLRKIDGGWLILNYLLYRDMMQRKAQSHAERQANYRERIKKRDASVTTRVTRDTEAEAEEEVEVEEEARKKKPSATVVAKEFALLWSECVKKVGKAAAAKAYASARKRGAPSVEEIIAKLNAWQDTPQWSKDSRQFQPHLSTWLNRDGWEDEVPASGGSAKASVDTRVCNRCLGKTYVEVDADLGSRHNPETGQSERVMKRVTCSRCQGSGRF